MYEYASAADSSGGSPARRGHKKETTCGFLLLVNLPLSLRGHGENRRDETAPKRGTAEDFSSVGEHSVLPCPCLYAVPDTLLLHMRFRLRRRDIPVSRNPLARCNGRHLRI